MPLSRLQANKYRSRLISTAIITILIVLIGASIAIPIWVNGYIGTISTQWRKQNQISEQQGRYIGDIYRHFGFGGMIYNFKNYVLRQDPALNQAIRHDIADLNVTLTRLEATFAQDNTRVSLNRAAIKSIRDNIEAYSQKLDIAETAAREHWPPSRTDTLVRVDDREAIAALWSLRESWLRQDELSRAEFEKLVLEASTRLRYFLLFVPFLAISGFGVVWFVRRLTSEIEKRESAEIERQRAEFMVQSIGLLGSGVSIFDGNLKLVAFNTIYFDLLEFPKEMATPGRPSPIFSVTTPNVANTAPATSRSKSMTASNWH